MVKEKYNLICKLEVKRLDVTNYFLRNSIIENDLNELLNKFKARGVGLFVYFENINGIIEKQVADKFNAVKACVRYDLTCIISSDAVMRLRQFLSILFNNFITLFM